MKKTEIKEAGVITQIKRYDDDSDYEYQLLLDVRERRNDDLAPEKKHVATKGERKRKLKLKLKPPKEKAPVRIFREGFCSGGGNGGLEKVKITRIAVLRLRMILVRCLSMKQKD
uniref:Uncharacterized protein n=1 Tax=Kalanchoe fedtschenkoi TaxID=63787 RepID=A0A7N0VCX1_KALFE